ncbi:MAG: hypothetical protein CMM76_10755 [Rhodospirillaceae bacterium]|nr:hypothetical protein [Rhodospirillaceae bacterium]|tara:strand:- start:1305 stop:1526 length:222 start_codon:yes stop_codon:yes gene_type:complete
MISKIKGVVTDLTDIGLCLLALFIVVALLIGAGNVGPMGSVVANIISLVDGLAKGGLAGLIGIGIILWLFSRK